MINLKGFARDVLVELADPTHEKRDRAAHTQRLALQIATLETELARYRITVDADTPPPDHIRHAVTTTVTGDVITHVAGDLWTRTGAAEALPWRTWWLRCGQLIPLVPAAGGDRDA